MTIENHDPTPSKVEAKKVNPEAIKSVVDKNISKLRTAETQEAALDCVLDMKMQCMEKNVPFDEVQKQMVAGLGSNISNAVKGVIRGVVTNPQGITAAAQLLS